jgi:agmatinase
MEHPPFIPFAHGETKVCSFEDAEIVILPIPYESALSYGTGCGKAPYYILDASTQLESIDEETLINWGEFSIHTLLPFVTDSEPEKAVDQMEEVALSVFTKNKFLLSIGGDHAVSIGLIRAASKKFPRMGVLQFDAHLDLRNEWNGSRFNHACVMRRVVDDMGLPVIQAGIRSFSSEEAILVKKRGYKPFYAHNISPLDNGWMDEAIERLPEKIYLSIDVDGLDPSVMPGTGTPEPGGLSYRQLIRLIEKLGKKRHVIGSDINEVMPIEGFHVSEFTAAKIASKVIVYCTETGKISKTKQTVLAHPHRI